MDERWILAFDATCATCTKISAAVGQACGGRLEVLPLSRDDVRQWRRQALGQNPSWAPTLIRLRDGLPHAWTGARMTARLARLLGPRSSMRVVRALGQLRHETLAPRPSTAMGRRQLLTFGVAGVAVAGGMILTGRTPAFAEQAKNSAAAWVAAHRNDLPTEYDEVVSYSMAYRKAIFQALPASARSRLWVAHIDHYRATHRGLTAEQSGVLYQIRAVAATERHFSANHDPAARDAAIKNVRAGAERAFGIDETRALLTTLGPAPAYAAPRQVLDTCPCSIQDDYCPRPWQCTEYNVPCDMTSWGCGGFYVYPCNGSCTSEA